MKLSDGRVVAILRALEQGCTRRAAAGAADIHHSTLYAWMSADPTFSDAVEKAEQKAEQKYTQVVAEAAPKNWQAAAWWLERRQHADYAKREHVTVDLTAAIKATAAEHGLDEAEVLAEAERVLAGSR